MAATLASLLTLSALPVLAQTSGERIQELEEKLALIERELTSLRSDMQQAEEAKTSEIQLLQENLDEQGQALTQTTQLAAGWKDSTSVTHLSGYASVDYVSPENANAAFNANFNPMFHFLYNDKVLWEAELEIEVAENGETEVGLEYTTLDLFLNDKLTLVAGKFLSPIGNFRQNLHPSWINKLPSAPPGFGHDGAAPISELGVQLRGVAPFERGGRLTYAGYVGNGPKVEAEDGEIHAIEAEGFASDPDDNKVFGGRVSYLPIPQLELAVSGAIGDVAVVEYDEVDIDGEPGRDYTVLGFDASYRIAGFDLRGEYVMQEIDDEQTSLAPEGGRWETWYAQAAYGFGQGKWEGVARYTDFNSPHGDESQEQWALGLNYLLSPSTLIKFGYEFNDGLPGEISDDDRWIAQIAYGY